MDLSTKYLGLKLRTPFVPAASPLSEEIDTLKQMEDAGASAVVLYSLFEEQLRQDSADLARHLEHGTYSFAEALTYFPQPEEFRLGPEEYLKHVSKAKQSLRIPVIASLNGSSVGGWTDYAKAIQQAGADAVEQHRARHDRVMRPGRRRNARCEASHPTANCRIQIDLGR